METSDNIPNMILIILILVAVCAYLWKLYKDSESYSRCPNCGKVWAGENMKEKLLGIFQKGISANRSLTIKGSLFQEMDVKMAWYEKYEIQRRCKFCGHEWISIRSIKQ
jgi:hypothetical protein